MQVAGYLLPYFPQLLSQVEQERCELVECRIGTPEDRQYSLMLCLKECDLQ